jgi:hypothetical protein
MADPGLDRDREPPGIKKAAGCEEAAQGWRLGSSKLLRPLFAWEVDVEVFSRDFDVDIFCAVAWKDVQ